MTISLSLLKPDTLAVAFPYNEQHITAIKSLARRRWNPKQKQWEVHLAHLPDLIKMLELDEGAVAPEIRENWERDWSQAGVRISLGPLKGKIDGIDAPLDAIDEETSFLVSGYKYSPKYRQKKWDGKKHLFAIKTGRFPSGLWPRIRRLLKESGIEYEFENKPAKLGARLELGIETPPTPLRDYQSSALDKALLRRRGIVQIATGGGKTLLAAHLVARIGRPAFFFVHTLDLLYQTARVFERELGIEIGILGDGQARLRPVTVATVQTAARALQLKAETPPAGDEAPGEEAPLELDDAELHEVQKALKTVPVAIFDECHHVPADMFYKLALKMEGAAWRYGLSATPWRADGCDLMLEAALGPQICKIDCSTLIERGFLIAPAIRMRPVGGAQFRGKGFSYAEVYQQAIVENRTRNRAIAAQALYWAEEGMSVLILVNQIAHGECLLELMPEARFASSRLDGAERQQYLDELERKLHPILIATTLADEGLDVPSLDALILAGGGKSETRAYQRIGRALRPSPGKTTARVLDFLDDAPWLRDHSRARLDLYRAEPRFLIEME